MRGELNFLGTEAALRHQGHAERFQSWPAVVLIGILITMPRVVEYDLAISFCLAFVLAVELLCIGNPYIPYLLLFGVCAMVRYAYFHTALNDGIQALCILLLFFLVCGALNKGAASGIPELEAVPKR